LKRAQAQAHETGAALRIARELIFQKLYGQERVARFKLLDTKTADAIGGFRRRLQQCETLDSIRRLEAQAALEYWSAWKELPIAFPRNDLPRIPQHWKTFGSRFSPLTVPLDWQPNLVGLFSTISTHCLNQNHVSPFVFSVLIHLWECFTSIFNIATAWHATLWRLHEQVWTPMLLTGSRVNH